MKFKHVVLIVLLVLIADQTLKIYIKTHFLLGDHINVLGDWFRLHFIENEGMAFGMTFGGAFGKIFLTLFRLIACVWGFFFINGLIKKHHHKLLIICASLILAGAIGNLLDSLFYGMIFTNSFHGVAKLVPWGQGYGKFLYGSVVDMLYFPIISTTWPAWVPLWGGQSLEFFRPVFNIADAAISTGVITILVFQQKILKSGNTTISSAN